MAKKQTPVTATGNFSRIETLQAFPTTVLKDWLRKLKIGIPKTKLDMVKRLAGDERVKVEVSVTVLTCGH